MLMSFLDPDLHRGVKFVFFICFETDLAIFGSFGCFDTDSKHRNEPKNLFFGLAKQTENQPKQMEFRFVLV
jgi:hypothetical protein